MNSITMKKIWVWNINSQQFIINKNQIKTHSILKVKTSLMQQVQLPIMKVFTYHRIYNNCTIVIKNKYIYLSFLLKKMKNELQINQSHIVGILLKLHILDKLRKVDLLSICMEMIYFILIQQIWIRWKSKNNNNSHSKYNKFYSISKYYNL